MSENVVYIELLDGTRMSVACAARCGDLAVTRALPSGDGWAITHMPTSVRMPALFPTAAAASSAMTDLAAAVDWPALVARLAAGRGVTQATIDLVMDIVEANGGRRWQGGKKYQAPPAHYRRVLGLDTAQ